MNDLAVNAVELARQPGAVRHVDTVVALADLDAVDPRLGGAAGDAGDVAVDLTLESTLDDIVVTGTLTVEWSDECRRCLRPLADTLRIDVEERYADSPELDEFPITNGQIDLRPMVREEVLLAIPDAPLAGTTALDCPVCGSTSSRRRITGIPRSGTSVGPSSTSCGSHSGGCHLHRGATLRPGAGAARGRHQEGAAMARWLSRSKWWPIPTVLIAPVLAVTLTVTPSVAQRPRQPKRSRSTTGGPQSWTVPADVHQVTFDAHGGPGWRRQLHPREGERWRAIATMPVQPGQQFVIMVGGRASTGGQFGLHRRRRRGWVRRSGAGSTAAGTVEAPEAGLFDWRWWRCPTCAS